MSHANLEGRIRELEDRIAKLEEPATPAAEKPKK